MSAPPLPSGPPPLPKEPPPLPKGKPPLPNSAPPVDAVRSSLVTKASKGGNGDSGSASLAPPLPTSKPPLPKSTPPLPKSKPPLPPTKPPQGKTLSSAQTNEKSAGSSKPTSGPNKEQRDKDKRSASPTDLEPGEIVSDSMDTKASGSKRSSKGQYKRFRNRPEPPLLKDKFRRFRKQDPRGAEAACKTFFDDLRRKGKVSKNELKRKRGESVCFGYTNFHRRTVDSYKIIQQVGEGTFGEVYKARDLYNGHTVALKKTKVHFEKEGFPLTALREIKLLLNLQHPNVVGLRDIVPSKASPNDTDLGTVYLVFEYLENDLTGLMENTRVQLTEAHVKCYMKQLLEGMHYIHTNNVIHRDIKAANLLVSNDGKLKIGDWGLGRSWVPGEKYSTRVVTLWYRAPELLLGQARYTPAIDLWAVGCIFAELLGKKSVLPGKNEVDQLELTLKLCGTPTKAELPAFHATKIDLPVYERTFEKRFAWMVPEAMGLLDGLLTLDPTKRLTAAEALDHDYFWVGTSPCKPSQLPKIKGGTHEYEVRQAATERSNQRRNKWSHYKKQ